MKLLITGGCGFLGSNLAAKYLKEGHKVCIVDSLFREGSSLNLEWLNSIASLNQLQFIKQDLANRDEVKEIFKNYGPFEYVCHVAGQVAMTKSIENPHRDLLTNVLGTFNLLDACGKFSPNAFFAYSSTNKVYGDLKYLNYEESELRYLLPDFPQGLNEELNLDFSTPYGCSKGAADQYVRDWARVFNLKTVVFRHSSIYGGRQFASFDQGWIGWFCKKAIMQQSDFQNGITPQPFFIAGTGKQVRDVLHADDLINLYQKAFLEKEKIFGQIFNIGGGVENSLSILELFNILEDILGIDKLKFKNNPKRASDQDVFIADIAKAKNKIKWEPKINKKEGLISMLDWTRKILNN